MNKYFLIVFGFSSLLFGQRENYNRVLINNNFSYEVNQIFDSSGETVFLLSYRIPVTKLIFIKKNENRFESGINVSFNFKEKEKIKRFFNHQEIDFDNFNDTQNSNNFLEGFVKFFLPDGIYSLQIELSIYNVESPFFLDAGKVKINSNDYSGPLILKKYSDSFNLINQSGTIPFGENGIFVVFIEKQNRKTTDLIIKQKEFNLVISPQMLDSITIKLPDLLNTSMLRFSKKDYSISLFELKTENLSDDLITIKNDGLKYEDTLKVSWYNKPLSLSNRESALLAMSMIFNESSIKSLEEADEDNFFIELENFWKEKDLTPETKFNETMNAFFKRADVATRRFKTADGGNGIKTDRGMVFLKYGEPDEIRRNYSNKLASEIWYYNDLKLVFRFKDISGLGKFQLAKE